MNHRVRVLSDKANFTSCQILLGHDELLMSGSFSGQGECAVWYSGNRKGYSFINQQIK